ncbi:MAG TPA: GNAT family N-acetyltransferase [Rhizomicrobium sp.]|nr:GNAT family N-acetyltransferase [Rhizomicrobium sp.]
MALDSRYTWRQADTGDAPQLELLMNAAIAQLLAPYLPPEEVTASFAIMGLDRQLIDDGTYMVVEHKKRIVASGGWSARATLFGGDHTQGRNAAHVDPATESARMRAMYTHPDHTRRGLGRFILAESERQAQTRGFRRATLVATMAGLPLYRACHYREVEHFRESTPTGVSVPLVRMEKPLVP